VLTRFLTLDDEKHEPDQQANADNEPQRPANARAPIFDRVGPVGVCSSDVIARAFAVRATDEAGSVSLATRSMMRRDSSSLSWRPAMAMPCFRSDFNLFARPVTGPDSEW
jgi:hypothetical protein